MKVIKWWFQTDFSREVLEGEFEVADDTPEEEIEELAKLEAFEYKVGVGKKRRLFNERQV